MRANGGFFRFASRSPGSKFDHSPVKNADSLPQIFEIFPFLGDRSPRPGSIYTAWLDRSVYRRGFRLSVLLGGIDRGATPAGRSDQRDAGNGEKTVGALGRGAAGPVFLHVGTAVVEPTDGHTYDPTDGATTDPYPEVPACASAAVPERANAVASTIVVSFMAVSFLVV